jgi:PKHD-type hydroxylase
VSRTYLAVPGALSEAECDAAIALADAGRTARGPVYGGGGAEVDPSRRDVQSTLVARSEAEWLFETLDSLFQTAAREFGLPVGPLSEEIQILRYDEGGHFRMWHSDAGLDHVERRRISVSVELSGRRDYEGGELEVVPDLVGRARTLPRGGAQLFPSRALHRVTPVTRGTRWALVAWTGAP